MRRLSNYNEFRRGIPYSKTLTDLGTGRLHIKGVMYVTAEEFSQMQTDLKNQLEEQTTVLEQALIELRQVKLHLASLSGENIEQEDVDD